VRTIADLHIHSRFSRATSKRISVEEIARFAKAKGLNLVGTGDFMHPKWIEELQEDLVELSDTGLLKPGKTAAGVRFMLSGEVSTIFEFRGRTKKIHHLILTPSFETAKQVNSRLGRYGQLNLDGRPTLEMSAAHLVEEVKAVSADNEVIPAHAWTPWFSLFGAFSGFDRIEDCYQDMTKHIHALETGLSSDPPMNWRLSTLDRFSLVSNSDSHSCWPWRIGREANVFDLQRITYSEVLNAIQEKDNQRFRFTIETYPAYGKYHWTGHRSCNISMPLGEAAKINSICPVCRRQLTKGVDQRVEELADRPAHYRPSNAIDFMHLLPLSEIIAKVINASSVEAQSVWKIYNDLISRFGNEYRVLIDAPVEEISQVTERETAEAIEKARKNRVKITPGYDGVYGQLAFLERDEYEEAQSIGTEQRSLTEWCN
jgi:uncharacterized protein (TIGR00375 family)